ncbi:MAG: hypothetical protein AAF718_18315 [Pseudomonadota bacterium]
MKPKTLTKREQNALIKVHRKAIDQETKAMIKGSGWRFLGQYGCAVCEIDSLFAEASYSFNSPEFYSDVGLACAVKPMDADPLFWEIMDISGNESKPLSFRSTGAHTCRSMTIFERTIAGQNTEKAAIEFRNHLDEMRIYVSSLEGSFADKVAIQRLETDRKKRTYFQTHVIALILESRRDEAAFMLEDGLINELSTHYSFYEREFHENQRLDKGSVKRRSFAEMALIWLETKNKFGEAP